MTTLLLLLSLAQGHANSWEAGRETERLWQEYDVEQQIEALVKKSETDKRPSASPYFSGSMGLYERAVIGEGNPRAGIFADVGLQYFRFPSLQLSLSDAQKRLRTRLREALARSVQMGKPFSKQALEDAARQIWKEEQNTGVLQRPKRDTVWPKPGLGFHLSNAMTLMMDEVEIRLVGSIGLWRIKLGVVAGMTIDRKKFLGFGATYGYEVAVPLFLVKRSTHTQAMQWIEPFARMEEQGRSGTVLSIGVRMSLGAPMPALVNPDS